MSVTSIVMSMDDKDKNKFISQYMCSVCKGCRVGTDKCQLCNVKVCEDSNYKGCSMRKRNWYGGNHICNTCWINQRE
jgi:hypothetical protein